MLRSVATATTTQNGGGIARLPSRGIPSKPVVLAKRSATAIPTGPTAPRPGQRSISNFPTSNGNTHGTGAFRNFGNASGTFRNLNLGPTGGKVGGAGGVRRDEPASGVESADANMAASMSEMEMPIEAAMVADMKAMPGANGTGRPPVFSYDGNAVEQQADKSVAFVMRSTGFYQRFSSYLFLVMAKFPLSFLILSSFLSYLTTGDAVMQQAIRDKYEGQSLPAYAISANNFGHMWMVVTFMNGLAAVCVARRMPPVADRTRVIILNALQVWFVALLIKVLWLKVAQQNSDLLMMIYSFILWSFVMVTFKKFKRISKGAGHLMRIYSYWCAYNVLLSIYIFNHNKGYTQAIVEMVVPTAAPA